MSNNSRIAKNTVFLYIRMLFVLIVSLYTSRVIINVLGIEDYGIYNVVAGFVSMFSFLNATLSSSIQRFYNYEGTRNANEGFRQVYISGLLIHLVLAIIILVLIETLGLWYINHMMNLPESRLFAAKFVFQTSAISLIILLLQIPFLGAIMAKEHMSYYAIVSIVEVVLRLGLVIWIQYISYDKLIIYGIFSLLINIINFLFYFIYSRIKFSEIRFRFQIYRHLLKQILGFSLWNVIGTFAFMLKGQGLNMILNLFFGPIVNAARGVAYQVNGAISGFAQNITIAFRPEIVNSYASKSYLRVTNLIYTESRVCYMLIAILITPLFSNIEYVLNLWLDGTVPQMTAIFTILLLVDTLVCTLNTPITQVVMATGEIKTYQLASTVINLLLIPICYIFLKIGYDAVSVFIITIIISIINQIVCLVTASKVFKIECIDYLKKVILPCVLFSTILLAITYLCNIVLDKSFLRLVISIGVELLVAIPLAYLLGFDESQKSLLRAKLMSKFKS